MLKPRRVVVAKSCAKTLKAGDSNSPTNITIEFISPSQSDIELISFLKSAKSSMANIYSRLHIMEGTFPVAVELENYELTALSFKKMSGGWATNNIIFEFVCNHIRQYIL